MLRPSIYRRNNDLMDSMDSMFDHFFQDPFFTQGNQLMSAMSTDIKESEDGFTLETELPGFNREDISATLENGYLTISADHEDKKEEKDKKDKFIRRERYAGHYQRSFYVGEEVTQEDIKGKYKDGVLTVFVPKKEEKPAVEQKKYISIEG